MFISCFKYEKVIVHGRFELRHYSDLSQHIKEPQMVFTVWIKK